jgi:hypothetical protein
MGQVDRDLLIDAAPNVVRLSDYRPRSNFDVRVEEIARMFMAQRAAERAERRMPPAGPAGSTVTSSQRDRRRN